MTQLSFRPATPDDVDAVADLWTTGWHQGHAETAPVELTALRTRESFAERTLAHLNGTVLCFRNHMFAGFFMLDGNEIYQFYVALAAQGSDVAALQMAEAERLLKDRGHDHSWLACGLGNARAARFYEKTGWQNMGPRPVMLETSAGPFPLEIIRFEKQLG